MRKLHWILLLVFLPFFAEASHYTSGYISLKYISGTTYQATIVTFVVGNPENSYLCNDTTNANQDTMRLYWGDGNSTLLTRSNGKGDSVCECIKMNTYVAIHTFPGPGNYRLAFDASVRVPGIMNMSNSSFTDMVIFHTFTINPISADTSFPVITNPPICSLGCLSKCYTFNLGAYSPAGDSLSYSLGYCLGSIGYVIPPNASINPVTGTLTWCSPNFPGLYNFSIRITTYHRTIISGDTLQIPVDTEEVELQATIDSACLSGINTIKNPAGYSIYPNPSNGIFTVALNHPELVAGLQTITIYNTFGETIYEGTLKQVQGNCEINLSTQPNGIYLYRILNSDATLFGEGKVIIQK